jgi:ankyrin repeat protein
MSWAANRETKREEDIAYSLLGILEINMSLIYGEGRQKALWRLMDEVNRHSSRVHEINWPSDFLQPDLVSAKLAEISLSQASSLVPFKGGPNLRPGEMEISSSELQNGVYNCHQTYAVAHMFVAVQDLQEQVEFTLFPKEIQLFMKNERRRAREFAETTVNDWLDVTEFDKQYSVHQQFDKQLSIRLDGTCGWVFDKPEYIAWESDDFQGNRSKFLWICGPAGYGKTVICARLADYFKSIQDRKSYIFFSSSHAASAGDLSYIIRSWIAQIVREDPSALGFTLDFCEKSKVRRRGSDTEVWTLFKSLLTQHRLLNLFLDGLDEYPPLEECRGEFLRQLKEASVGTATRFLISSRDEGDIKTELTSGISHLADQILLNYRISSEDVKHDVVLYSKNVVDLKLPKKDEDFREKLANRLAERCDGMFLWVKMQQGQLKGSRNPKQLERIVENMPTGLNSTYERNWTAIKGKPLDEQHRAFTILTWATFALRPLTISELSEVLTIESNDSEMRFQLDELPDQIDDNYIEDEFIRVCGSLIEVQGDERATPGSRTIHLVHSSVREFLLSVLNSKPGTFTVAPSIEYQTDQSYQHSLLTRTCLAYLNDQQIWKCLDEDQDLTQRRSFRNYATIFWHLHVKKAKRDDQQIFTAINQFFQLDNKNFTVWAKTFECLQNPGNRGRAIGSPMYYAALFDFLSIMESIWKKDKSQLDSVGGQYGTPIQAACAKGNFLPFEALMKWSADPNIEAGEFGVALVASASMNFKGMVTSLIGKRAKLELKDTTGRTALYTSAANGHSEVVQILLDEGADASTSNNNGWTPVSIAASNGHVDVVKLLLNHHGVDASIPNNSGWTSVNSAAYNGHVDVVKLLVNHGVDASIPNNDGWTPMKSAASNGHVDIVKLLLNHHGVDASIPSNSGWTPVSIAASNGHVDVIKLLLDHHGVDASIPNNSGWTPVNNAAYNGHVDVVKLLLDHHGVDASIPNNDGWTPMKSAASKGHVDVVKLLLNHHGVDASIPSNSGWTSVNSAASNGHADIVKLLLNHHGVDASIPNNDGWTPMNSAASKGHVNVVKLLLNHHGVDASIPSNSGWTPVNSAAYNGHVDVIKLLLNHHGVDASIPSNSGWTPVNSAAYNGHADVIKLLLIHHGVDASIPNNSGWTPVNSAASNGHVDIVKLLVDYGVDASIPSNSGQTPMHSAVEMGHIEICNLLLDHGTALETTNNDGWTTAHFAAYNGHISILQIFVEKHNVDLAATDRFGRNILHFAVRGAHLPCVDYLLHKGLRYMDTDNFGNNILYYACSSGSIDIVQKLWNMNPQGLENWGTWSPLHWACRIGCSRLIEFLIHQGISKALVRTEQPPAVWSPVSIAIFHQNPDVESIKHKMLRESDIATVLNTSTAFMSASELVMSTIGSRYKSFYCNMCLHVRVVKRFKFIINWIIGHIWTLFPLW